jgi:hypothetical protein
LAGCGGVFAGDFTVDLLTLLDVEVYIYFPFLPLLANFFRRGFACCCYSVKAGLRAITFV